MDLYNHEDDSRGVFRPKELLTHSTIDEIISLKTRWCRMTKKDQEILAAIAEAVMETPEEVALRYNPYLSEAGARKAVRRAFDRFKKGLITDCDRAGFHIIYEALFN